MFIDTGYKVYAQSCPPPPGGVFTGGGAGGGNSTNWWTTITDWINDVVSWIGEQWGNNTGSPSGSGGLPTPPWWPSGSGGLPTPPWWPSGGGYGVYDPTGGGGGGSGGGQSPWPDSLNYTGLSYGFSCTIVFPTNCDPLTDPTCLATFNCINNLPTGLFNDCHGDAFGFAYLDSCNKCVGGTTGLLPCKGFLDSNNIFVDSVRKQPCDSLYKKMGDSLYAFLNKPEFQDSLNKFKRNTAEDTLEKAISFGRDSVTFAFKNTPIKDIPDSGFGSQKINLINKWPGIKIYTMMHYHHNALYGCFSAGDLYTLQNAYSNPNLNQINSHYVYGSFDSSMFAMQIEDSLLYSQYLSGHPISTTMDTNNSFDTTTNIGTDFLNVKSYLFTTLGLSDDDAFTQATAFVYSKFNTGMVLYRKKRNENKFTKINTKETIDAAGNKTYTPSNCL
ncbi:MAG: hypothetical protein ABL929_11045 [Ferruginibacter sp.]